MTPTQTMVAAMYELDADDLGYQVVLWDDAKEKVQRTLAAAVGVTIARAAYDEAIVQYGGPHHHIILKIGSRVICDSARTKL